MRLDLSEILNLPSWWSVKWTPTALQLKKFSIIGHSMGESTINLCCTFCSYKVISITLEHLFIYRCWHCWNGKSLIRLLCVMSLSSFSHILLVFVCGIIIWSKCYFPTVQCTVSWDGGRSCTSGLFRAPTYRFSTNHFDPPHCSHCRALMVKRRARIVWPDTKRKV